MLLRVQRLDGTKNQGAAKTALTTKGLQRHRLPADVQVRGRPGPQIQSIAHPLAYLGDEPGS
jgi:hypothetical protein